MFKSPIIPSSHGFGIWFNKKEKKEYRKILRIHKWISENNFSYPEWNCSFSKHCIHTI